MPRGSLYLVAIMDWFSRKVLSWRLSNSMEAYFCVKALKEAITKHSKPEIRAANSLGFNGRRREGCGYQDIHGQQGALGRQPDDQAPMAGH